MSLPYSTDSRSVSDGDPTDCLHSAGEETAIGRNLLHPRVVRFNVLGVPQPKGSARGFVVMKAGQKPRAIVTSDNKNLRGWADSVRYAAQDACGETFFDAAVQLQIAFTFSRPKSVSAKKRPYMTTRPDTSKLVRAAEDALNGIVWKDDAQVVAIIATKAYVDGPGGAVVTVTEVQP